MSLLAQDWPQKKEPLVLDGFYKFELKPQTTPIGPCMVLSGDRRGGQKKDGDQLNSPRYYCLPRPHGSLNSEAKGLG